MNGTCELMYNNTFKLVQIQLIQMMIHMEMLRWRVQMMSMRMMVMNMTMMRTQSDPSCRK